MNHVLGLIKMNSSVAIEMDKSCRMQTIIGKKAEQLGHF